MRTIGLVVFLVGCAGDGKDETSGDTADTTDSPADTDTTDTDVGLGCVNIGSGSWNADGSAFGAGSTTLTMDITTCSFTLTDWVATDTGTVADRPASGTLVDAAVTLGGDAHWETCTGAATADGFSMSGTCSDDSTEFHLSRAH